MVMGSALQYSADTVGDNSDDGAEQTDRSGSAKKVNRA